MSEPPFVRPPRIAAWLVDLFTPTSQAESIPGDLVEEFSEVASKSGVTSARRWYWRQSVKTIAHLVGSAFRSAPWLIAGTTVGGQILWWTGIWLTWKIVIAILGQYQVYAHIDAHVFWLLYAFLIERVVEPFIVGCIVAMIARGREMVATMTLGIVACAPRGYLLLQGLRHDWSATVFWLRPELMITFVSPLIVVIGGLVVREIRSAVSRRLSVMAH